MLLLLTCSIMNFDCEYLMRRLQSFLVEYLVSGTSHAAAEQQSESGLAADYSSKLKVLQQHNSHLKTGNNCQQAEDGGGRGE